MPVSRRYAKRSKSSRIEWASFTKKYFLQRETLAAVLLLVDASIPPQPADLEVANWLGEAEARPFVRFPPLSGSVIRSPGHILDKPRM